MNREAWLTEMAKLLEPCFRGYKLPPYRLTCGWPCRNALGTRARRIGECHGPKSNKGGTSEIFISPLLEKPIDVVGTVIHEMAHVVAGVEAAHGPEFVKVCKAAGITKGKPTSAGPGKELEAKILKLADQLGPYPHHGILLVPKPHVKTPPSKSLECPSCGCVVRIEVTWLEAVGPPKCGCGFGEMEIKSRKDED